MAGVELGYAEITTTATATTEADVAGLAVTVTVGTRPILVKMGCGQLYNNNASGYAIVQLKEGATTLAGWTWGTGVASVQSGYFREARLSPTAGSHTYKVTLQGFIAGTTTISASSTQPAYIQVVEI